MINGSQAFNEAVTAGGYPYTARLSYEGTPIECTIASCKIYKGSTGNDTFSIGSLYIPYIEVEAIELTVPIYSKELKLEVGVILSDEQAEWITVGYFTVTKVNTSTVKTSFTAMGRIASVLPKVQVSVSSTMTPAQLIQATQTAVRNAGYSDFIIDVSGVTLSTAPLTELVAMNAQAAIERVAEITGVYGTEDGDGNVVLFKYDITNYIDYNGSRMIDHPIFQEEQFELNNVKVIKSEETEDEEGRVVPEVAFISGVPYEWVVYNEFMTAELFTAYCQNCLGLTYRPATIRLAHGDPRLEAKDVLRITDIDDNVYIVPAMTVIHSVVGGLTTEIIAPHEGEGEIDVEGGGKGPITQQLDKMGRNLAITEASAAIAKTKAEEAERDADSAKRSAQEAWDKANEVNTLATQAKEDARVAKEQSEIATSSANTALIGLSQVESVIDTLNWIATHGEYIKATTYIEGTTYYTLTGAVEPSPYAERKYYILSGGIYTQTDVQATVVAEPVLSDIRTYYELIDGRYVLTEDTEVDPNKTYYTISDTYYITTGTPVSIPKPEDIGQYYTLDVTDAIGDYIQTHLAVTNDGLYVMADNSQWKVKVSDNGVYILDPNNRAANTMNKDGSVIGYEGETRVEIDYHSLRLIDKEGDPYVYFSDLRNSEGVYEGTTEYEINDNTDIGSLVFTFDMSVSEIVSVTCNGVALSYRPQLPSMIIIDTSSLSIGNIIIIVFKSTDRMLKAFTFGRRKDGELVGMHSFAFGYEVTASGLRSHAVGNSTTASGNFAHAEGSRTTASGYFAHAEGARTKASGWWSHAEGLETKASMDYSHAEGYTTTASGRSSHAEGTQTKASEHSSHAEGSWTTASGRASHAEGSSATASGYASHAQNYDTIAGYHSQTAIGKYNDNKSTSAFEIGNGTADDARKNALEVTWNGMVSLTGNRNIDGTSQEVIVPYFNLGAGLTPTQVADGIVKKIVQLYGTSAYVHTRFKGRAQASSNLYYDLYIYDPTDKQNGLPKYSFGSMYRYGGTEYMFGTQSYALYVKNVVANGVPNTVTSYDNTKFTYAAGFGAYSTTDSSAPCADKFGRIVTLSGAFKATAAQTSTSQKTIGKVPAGCEPLRTLRVIEQGSGTARFLLTIYPSGVLMAERYSSNGTDTAIPNGAWLNIFATYISKT